MNNPILQWNELEHVFRSPSQLYRLGRFYRDNGPASEQEARTRSRCHLDPHIVITAHHVKLWPYKKLVLYCDIFSIGLRFHRSNMLVRYFLIVGLFGCSMAQSGNEFIDAIIAHLRVSPMLNQRLNQTRYNGALSVQDNIQISNISAENLLNLRRVGNATVMVDPFGELHLRTSLSLSDVVVRALYSYQSWITLRGSMAFLMPNITMNIHTTLGNLTRMTLRTFRVRDVSPPQVIDFTGATALFNWLGNRRVAAFMNNSTQLIVENIENFVFNGVTNVMTNERRCLPLKNYAVSGLVATDLEWNDATGINGR